MTPERGIEDQPKSSEVRVGAMADDGSSFGPFRYDPAEALLYRDGAPVRLGGRAQRLLALLIERAGAIVTKADLIDAAWPEQAVEESNLSVQIAQLRKVIGANRIRTVERVGYSLQIAPSTPAPVLTVGDFTGGDAAREVRDELIALLAGFDGFTLSGGAGPSGQVPARYRLQGVVQLRRHAMRLGVYLVEAPSDRVLWGQMFDGGAPGLSTALERAAAMVEFEIGKAEVERSASSSLEEASPYQLHLRARALLRTARSDDNATALRLVEAALAAEPENTAFLATACEVLGGQRIPMGWEPLTQDDRALARTYAQRGLLSNASSASEIALFGTAMFRGGEPDFGYWTTRRGPELNPNSIMALVCAGNVVKQWGSPEEAAGYLHRALSLNPRDPLQRFSYAALSSIEMARGNYEDAIAWAQRAYTVNQYYAATHWHFIAANAQLNRLEAARAQVKRLLDIHPSTSMERIVSGQPTRTAHTANTFDGLARAGLN